VPSDLSYLHRCRPSLERERDERVPQAMEADSLLALPIQTCCVAGSVQRSQRVTAILRPAPARRKNERIGLHWPQAPLGLACALRDQLAAHDRQHPQGRGRRVCLTGTRSPRGPS
jgi:hypothetical protein